MKRTNILCVWLPNWPIQRLVVAQSELRQQRVVLYGNHAQRGQIVTAASPAAQLGGVRIDMPLSEAKSLAERSASPRIDNDTCYTFEHDPAADLRTLKSLAMQCHRFSPIVGLEQDAAPSCLLLDVTGLAHLFGGQAGLENQVYQHFQKLGYLVQLATAATIGMAWGLARFGQQLLARPAGMATRRPLRSPTPRRSNRKNIARFEQQLAVQPQSPQTTECFYQLPIEALRLETDTIDNLRQLGVNRIEQILQLPRGGLQSRFGNEITQRLDQANGKIHEVITALHPSADYATEKFLEYPVTDRQTIEVIISRLAASLCSEMRGQQRGGLVWQFTLRGPETEPLGLTIKLFRPTATLEQLMPLLQMQLDGIFSGRRHGKQTNQTKLQVQEIGLAVSNCVLLAERQRKLFDENPRLDRQALAELINRLSSRLGAENVTRPRLLSGAQAEQAACFESLVGGGKTESRQNRGPRLRQTISPWQRPLALLPEPLEITAISLDGLADRSSNIPAAFVHDNGRLRVVRRWGPERIETSWWRGPAIRRDYWRVEVERGRWLWIYRNLRSRRWFLHGEF